MSMPWLQWCRKIVPFSERRMINRVLESEGGVSTDPHDRGNFGGHITNMGITAPTLAAYRGVAAKTIKPSDIAALTPDTARRIAPKLYYRDPKIDTLPEWVRGAMTDWAFNSGQVHPIKALQAILNVRADGIIGPRTAAACAAADPDETLNDLCLARIRFLHRIVANDDSQRRFINGWEARAMKWRMRR